MTQKVFAQFTGISEGSLSGVFNGHTRPTLQMVDLIHQRFPNISTDWLMYGQGPMYRDQVEDKTEGEQAETNASLNAAVVQTSSPLLFSSDDIISTSIKQVVKYLDKPARKITEIRVYYDDQTWETFAPGRP